MKIALISLGVIGVAILLWGGLGFYVASNPPEDPTFTAALADQIWSSAVRESLLGLSVVGLAAFLWRREKAKDRVLGGLDGH